MCNSKTKQAPGIAPGIRGLQPLALLLGYACVLVFWARGTASNSQFTLAYILFSARANPSALLLGYAPDRI